MAESEKPAAAPAEVPTAAAVEEKTIAPAAPVIQEKATAEPATTPPVAQAEQVPMTAPQRTGGGLMGGIGGAIKGGAVGAIGTVAVNFGRRMMTSNKTLPLFGRTGMIATGVLAAAGLIMGFMKKKEAPMEQPAMPPAADMAQIPPASAAPEKAASKFRDMVSASKAEVSAEAVAAR